MLSGINSQKLINKFSCFAVHKALKNISNEIIYNFELRDGKFLLFGKNNCIALKFTTSKTLHCICDVEIKLQNSVDC